MRYLIIGLLLCGCTHRDPTFYVVRQQFVPATGPASGAGASWSSLSAAPRHPEIVWAQARAGIGDLFPVQDETGQTAFEVEVAEGDDDHLLLEIRSKEGSQRVGLPRDEPAQVHVGGRDYELLFPTVTVSSADVTTTSKALIIVTRR